MGSSSRKKFTGGSMHSNVGGHSYLLAVQVAH